MRPINLILFSLLFWSNALLSQCEIFNLTANPYGCAGIDSFYVDINFEYNNVGDNGFRILGNSIDHGTYPYSALPLTLGPFPANCVTAWEYIVRDIDTNICNDIYNLGTICCPDSCAISELSIDPLFCIGDSSYMVLVEFEYEDNLSDSFDIIINGDLALTAPYTSEGNTFTVPSSAEISDQIVICDKGNTMCCDTMVIISPCACIISNVTADLVGCSEQDGEFFVSIDCSFQNVADSFIVGGNNNNYGTFAFSELPLLLGPFPLDSSEYEFVVFDLVDPFCFDIVEMGVMDDCILDCIISDLVLNPVDCNLDDFFLLEMSFTAEMPGPNGFSIYVNDEFVNTFEYGFSPYTIGPLVGDCEQDYFVEIIDNEVPDCTLSDLLVNYCCEDALCSTDYTILVTGITCADSIVSAIVDLDYDILPGTGVDIFIDGQYNSSFNFLAFPQEINFDWQGNQTYLMEICLDGLPNCCNTINLPAINCGVDAICEISNVEAQMLGCNADGTFFASIFFDVFSPGLDGFVIQGNGVIYDTFAYNNGPYVVGPLIGDCETIYEFIVKDLANQDCSEFTVFDDVVCCDDGNCKIRELEATEFICFEDNLIFDLNFESSNTSGQFDLYINDTLKSTQAYNTLPLTVLHGDYNLELDVFTVKVCDTDSIDCCDEIEIPFSEFGKPCTIEFFDYDIVECEEGEFYLAFEWECIGDYEYTVSSLDGALLDVITCSNLPATIGPFIGDGESLYEVTVTADTASSDCENSFEFMAFDCPDVATNKTEWLELNVWFYSNTIVFRNFQDIESFSLFDLRGKKLIKENQIQSQNRIQGLNSGCYILQIQTDGNSFSQIVYLSN